MAATDNCCDNATKKILIFLDIDGVLLPFPDADKSSCGACFPDDNLTALSLILEAHPSAQLVLSSTWRARQSLITEILHSFMWYGKAFGGPLKYIQDFSDMTNPLIHTERQHEIYNYLFVDDEERKAAAWVALDDEELLEGSFNAKYRSYFEGHAVKVNSRIGLTKRDAAQAIELISLQLGERTTTYL